MLGRHEPMATDSERPGTATVDLRPVLTAVYGARLWIVAGIVAGLVAGVVAWRATGAEYEAVATLAVNQPKAGAGLPAVSMASYRALLENYSAANQVIKDVGLNRSGRPIDPERFLSRVLSIEELRDTNLIRVHVRLPDPEVARRAAQEVTDHAVALSRSLNDAEGMGRRTRLESQRKEAADRLEAARQKVVEFKSTSQVELLRAEITGLLKERKDLASVEADLAGETAMATAAAREQASRPSTLTFQRSIDRDAALTEVARPHAADDPKALLGVGMKSEEINPTYAKLDEQAALARARAARFAERRNEIASATASARNSGKLAALYRDEATLAALEADHALARRVYESVAQQSEEAQVVVSSGTAQLQIVDNAVVFPTPVSWSLPVWLAVGGIAGGALALGAVLVISGFRLLAAALAGAATA